MAIDARVATVINQTLHEQLQDIALTHNLTMSKTISTLLDICFSIQPKTILEMRAAKTVLGYDIIAEINDLIDEKKNRG